MCLYSDGSFLVQRFLWEAKIALSYLQHKKLLKTLKVAKKLTSTIYIGLTDTRVENLRVLQALRCTPVYFAEPVAILIHARGSRARPP